jgi:maltose O-acetyltransferase
VGSPFVVSPRDYNPGGASTMTARLRKLIAIAAIAVGKRTGRLGKMMSWQGFRRLLGPAGRRAAWRALGARIGENTRVGPGVWMRIPRNVSIGEGSKLGGRVTIESYGEVTIGKNTIINDSDLFTTQHELDHARFKSDEMFVRIGDYAWLPRKIIILPGVTIGNYAVVGTGSVVSRDVPDYAVVAGNPARVVKERARIDYEYVPSDVSKTATEVWRARRAADS